MSPEVLILKPLSRKKNQANESVKWFICDAFSCYLRHLDLTPNLPGGAGLFLFLHRVSGTGSQRSGRHEPLVVALTGSTGTGKTETAWVLAEAMLTKRCRISGGTKDIPRGLIVFK